VVSWTSVGRVSGHSSSTRVVTWLSSAAAASSLKVVVVRGQCRAVQAGIEYPPRTPMRAANLGGQADDRSGAAAQQGGGQTVVPHPAGELVDDAVVGSIPARRRPGQPPVPRGTPPDEWRRAPSRCPRHGSRTPGPIRYACAQHRRPSPIRSRTSSARCDGRRCAGTLPSKACRPQGHRRA
jgi:hypothetical protein